MNTAQQENVHLEKIYDEVVEYNDQLFCIVYDEHGRRHVEMRIKGEDNEWN